MTVLVVQTGWLWDAEFIGYFAAADLGLYASLGLDVQFLEGGPRVDPEAVLLHRDADLAISVPDSLAARVAAGSDLVAVGRQYARDPLAVILSAASGRTQVQQLAGTTIYVPDVSRTRVETSLAAHGVRWHEVELRPIESRRTRLTDDPDIAVIGYSTSLPADLLRLGEEPLSVIHLDSAIEPTVQNVISACRSTADGKREGMRRFLEASTTGWRTNAGDPELFPRTHRDQWFAHLDRDVEGEVAHNIAQQSFLAADLALDAEAKRSLGRIGKTHGIRDQSWIVTL